MVEKCILCDGTGRSITPPDYAKCTACNGTGKVIRIICTVCNGSVGKIPSGIGNTKRVPCWACGGKGYDEYSF